jgi:hypothetical protein
MRLCGQSLLQVLCGNLHGLEVDSRSWESGIVGEASDNRAGHGNELFSGLSREPVRNKDAIRHSNTLL